MKKKDLEIALQRVEPFQDPSPDLEQYSTPADIAADMLFTAYSQGDIEGLTVLDLGCGTGILAIGAALLGAAHVIGVDQDEGALRQAAENADRLGANVELVRSEVQQVDSKVDTVIMNPPFGAQRRHADRPFLEKAVRTAEVVYSLHNANTQDFLLRLVSSLGAEGMIQKRYKFEIPHTFAFHKKAKKDVEVVLLCIQTR
jgi:putative methylase